MLPISDPPAAPRAEMTSINDLPPELLMRVFDYFTLSTTGGGSGRSSWHDAYTLYKCAQVNQTWSLLSLPRLYEIIEIDSHEDAESLLLSSGLGRYPTRSLDIFTPSWFHKINEVLDRCLDLRMLDVSVLRLPVEMFEHRGLASLDSLKVGCYTEGVHPPSIPFRVKELAIILSEKTAMLVEAIVRVETTGSPPKLKRLRILDTTSDLQLLRLLHPVAINLEVLRDAFIHSNSAVNSDQQFNALRHFIGFASSLRHLRLQYQNVASSPTSDPYLSNRLQGVFQVVAPSIRRLDLAVTCPLLDPYSKQQRIPYDIAMALDLICEATERGQALADLEELSFSCQKRAALAAIEGWEPFAEDMTKKGIELTYYEDYY